MRHCADPRLACAGCDRRGPGRRVCRRLVEGRRGRRHRRARSRSRSSCPGQSGAVGAAVSAPPDGAALGQSFAYPSDGSVATTAGLTASAQTDVGAAASGTASADITSLSLFGGEITASSVSARARSNATGRGGSGDVGGSTVKNLVVLGQSVAVGPNTHVTLGDWGYATTLESATSKTHSSHAARLPRVRRRARRAPDRPAREPADGDGDHRRLRGDGRAGERADDDDRRRHDHEGHDADDHDRRRHLAACSQARQEEAPEAARAEAVGHERRHGRGAPTPAGPAPDAHRRPATSSRSTGRSRTRTRSASPAGRHDLAPRRRPLRAARRADPRGRRRHRLLGRLERRRRKPVLAARPAGQRVLLRAPVRVLAVREERARR